MLSYQVVDARAVAQRIVERAGHQAEEILAKARYARDAVVAEARALGYEEGLGQATEVLVRARVEASRLQASSSKQLVTLATRMAEKILASELALRPEAVVSVAARAMLQVAWCSKLVIHAHPQDVEAIRLHRSDLLSAAQIQADVVFVEDPSITRGGCLVDSEAGQIDASVESQLAALERALLEEDKP
ncbi:MAG: hypothetical protein J7M25_15895 [Deltaproteobacteria bacterium]|nr:hypothetical protein [Deltaproteobacteria bacterium]